MPPLDGVRVLTLALNLPGPVAVARLAGMGAAIHKIEPPGGDPFATLAAAWYADLHARVTVEPVDLKSVDGQARLDGLLAETDVLLTSQRPSALTRLGVSGAALGARAPHVRSVAIVGDTAAPERAGHDVTYQAEAGLLGTTLPSTLVADLAGAERAVTEVLLVLREPPGTHRVVGLRDALEPFTAPLRFGLTRASGVLGGALPAYGVFQAQDGYVAVAALEPHFRERLYALLGLPLEAPLAVAFALRTVADWQTIAAAHDLPIAALARPDVNR